MTFILYRHYLLTCLTSGDKAQTKLVIQVRNDYVINCQFDSETVSIGHREDPCPKCSGGYSIKDRGSPNVFMTDKVIL